MERNEMAFIKQSILVARDWDDFQALIRRCRLVLAGGLTTGRQQHKRE